MTDAYTPWYRQPMVWMLIAPPATAVIAGVITVAIAMQDPDSLVADDYYKEGLAINQRLERDRRAQELKVRAALVLEKGQVHLTLQAPAEPPQMKLTLAHATRAGFDQQLELERGEDGVYRSRTVLPALTAGRWQVWLEGADWRVGAQLEGNLGQAMTELTLHPAG